MSEIKYDVNFDDMRQLKQYILNLKRTNETSELLLNRETIKKYVSIYSDKIINILNEICKKS